MDKDVSEDKGSGKKRKLVTSALPYVNNIPHLGNIVGAVLSADVFARFSRSFGYETLFICGSDEHGTATETKALEEGLTPKELCDKYHVLHKEIYSWFNISFDYYGRTATGSHREITQGIFLRLWENGFISEDELEQLYCRSCDKFLADRFVEGTCPLCGYTDARGDQCDRCGQLLNAVELKEPRCKVCKGHPVVKSSEHLFIDLPKLKDPLLNWIDSRSKNWSQNAKTITYAWIKEGLKKRAISRDLKWGIPIPLEKYKDKVFYVWFDAPIGYISITKELLPDGWKGWWLDDKNVELYQFMGKDNIPFHTIIFPSTLLGTKDPYTMLHKISSTEYLNYEGGKFSKSRGEGVFGDDVMKAGIPADIFRYYLMMNRPERSDSVFLWKDLQEKNNNEIVANLGNLVNRTMTFISRYFEGRIPEGKPGLDDDAILQEIKSLEEDIAKRLHEAELKEALKRIMQISKIANGYFQDNEPWKAIKEDKESAERSMFVLANIVKDLSIVIEPFMPSAALEIRSQLGIKELCWQDLGSLSLKAGHSIGKPRAIFRKIEDDEIENLKIRFSGKKEFSLSLKAAKVISAENHPESEKLIVLQIDLGDEKRQIVAGLQKHYKCEEMVGKTIVIVSNLKKAKLGGLESNGMLLAAEFGEDVVLLDAEGIAPGEPLVPEGMVPVSKVITYKEFQKEKLVIASKEMTLDGLRIKSRHGIAARADMPDGSAIH